MIRLTNALRVTYGAVRGEVNVVDFIVIEAVRVFEPTVYDRVRARPDLFGVLTGIARAFPQTRDEEQKEYHLAWVEQISDGKRRESVKHLVARLFPEAAKALDVAIPVSRRRIDARRARAVSEPDYFPLYFRFALGEDVISRELVAGLLQTASDAEAFGDALLELAEQKTPAGRTRASVMLDELNAQAERGFAEADIPDVIKSLTSIGDKLWIESDDEFLGADNPSRIIWLIGGLLDRTPKENRCDVLETAINQAKSIATPVLLVRRVVRSLGEATRESTQTAAPENLDEAHGIVSIECAKRLERLAADKVSTAANAGELWGLPRFLYVVAEWNRWGDGEAVRSWVSKVLANDDDLARLLISSRSERKTTKGLRHRLDPRWFDDYAERDQVAAAVRRLRASASDSDPADACDQYLTELQMLDEGKDPEVRFDWD